LKIPRLVLRTHREINHPGIFSVLIKHCTKPTESTFPDIVGNCLAESFPKSGRFRSGPQLQKVVIDKTGGKYGAWMAQEFGFLTDNLFWSWKADAINCVVMPRSDFAAYLTLTRTEKLLYLRYYLEAQGPLLLKASQYFIATGKVSRHALLQDRWIDSMIIDVYSDYLHLTEDLSERTRVRQKIEALQQKPYDRNTRPHKIDALLFPMVDLGLLQAAIVDNDVVFSQNENHGVNATEILVKTLGSVAEMELLFSQYSYFGIAGKVHGIDYGVYDDARHRSVLQRRLIQAYVMGANRKPLVAINFLIDVVLTELLASDRLLVRPDDVELLLDDLSKRYPFEMHFQVDYRGKRAFVRLNQDFLQRISLGQV
jgi:hypothetical protein